MEYRRTREVIGILMLSEFYFDLTIAERYQLIKRIVGMISPA